MATDDTRHNYGVDICGCAWVFATNEEMDRIKSPGSLRMLDVVLQSATGREERSPVH
jgi:hypothetical protein